MKDYGKQHRFQEFMGTLPKGGSSQVHLHSPVLSEMERADYLNQIKTLTDTVAQLCNLLKSVTQALESVNKQSENKDLQIERLTLMIEGLRDEIRMLREQNGRMNKERFGSSGLKTRKGTKAPDPKKDRDEED